MSWDTNQTIIEQIQEELPKSTVYYLLIAIVMAQAWTVYLTYYHSRILGLIITALLNKFVKYGHIKLGSFSFSVLSGKIMFREVHLITEDYSIRAQYGWIIFRWWRPYIYKDLSEDFSHSETRMSLFLDGLEFHVYNRSANYAKLEKLFGLSPEMVPEQPPAETGQGSRIKVPENADGLHWRDLIPVTKIDINSGRVIFGNYLVPYTLVGSFEEAHLIYTTKPASTPFDKFMHVLKCKADNMKVMLVPSPKYTGPAADDEPPRYMGEGFVIMQSRDVDIYFYMDEPGIVPHEPELMEMADGEVVVRRTYPCMGVDIKCGRNTDLNYGPWVDRQREHLWKFFYPPDYQPQVPTTESEPGENRKFKTFEVKLTIISAATFDLLFTKNAETQAVHMNTGQGSYVEAIIPWMVDEKGYATKIKGQLMLLDMTTSMTFRSLVECETFEFEVSVFYPIVWNEHQDWRVDFTACKAIVYLIFEHKNFFRDLADDWSSKSRPDIYSFIPYTWTINLTVKQFELLTLANEYNWIDTSSHNPENAHVAFCGENMDLSLQLPFTDFLPTTIPIQIVIKGETVDCRLYLPESNTSRHIVMALSENMKIFDREGNPTHKPFGFGKTKPWKKVTSKSNGWVDCWSTTHVLLSIRYTFHPMPIKEAPVCLTPGIEKVLTPDKEEYLLKPLRPDQPKCSTSNTPDSFDASLWEPDVFSVELEVAPSVLCLYGSLFRFLINIKENYLGEDQKVADFKTEENSPECEDKDSSFVNITATNQEKTTVFDPRAYRPFAVTVSVILQDIQAHLVKNCDVDDIACPCARVERLCFELDKSYLETKLQLLLSPSVLIAKDSLVRDADQDHLKEGHLALSGLQVRGHAMFSHEGLSLDAETLEYAWLVEAISGEVTGRLTAPQIQNVAEFLQTFVLLIEDPENKLKRPVPWSVCQHMLPQPTCRMLPSYPLPCPSSDDIKYRLVRASVDSVNIFLVESGAALNIQVSSVRLSTCNLHGCNTRSGITCVVDLVTLKQLISCAPLRIEPGHPEMWLDAGGFSFGPLNVEAAMALPNVELHQIQDNFLHLHDKKTKKLWFLWPISTTHANQNPVIAGKCGCLGGCAFFGKNKNGTTFFKSRRQRESTNVAIPQIFPEGVDPGFAQSLLHKDKLVFDVGHSLKPEISPTEFSFTRGYMSDVASPDTPGSMSATLMDSLFMGTVTEHSELDTSRDNTLTRDTPSLKRYSKRSSTSDRKGLEVKPDPKVRNTSSTSIHFSDDKQSLEGSTLRRQTSITASTCSSSPSSPSYPRNRYSPGTASVDTASLYKTASKTSIPSPVPMHRIAGSKTDVDRVRSTVSLESDRYYSAEEDAYSLSEAESQQQLYHSLLSETTGSPSSPGFDFSFGSPDKSMEKTVLERKKFMDSDLDIDFSESDSTSTLSYESAPTDQESEAMSGEAPEEFSLIDLHSQMNQPITKSPLLLSRYSNHLSHYNCHDWMAPPPIASLHSAGKSIHSLQSEHSLSSASRSVYGSASSWIPQFTKVRQGFSTTVMKEKNELKLPSPPGPRKSEVFDWSKLDYRKEEEEPDDRHHLENTSKTTAVIKVAGTFDILVTPLLLEALQRFIEAVTPSMASMHPSALLDRLHSQCLDQLQQQNKLKKGQAGNSEEQDATSEPPSHPISHKGSTDKRTSDVVKTSSLQAFFSLPKVNLCVMQASLVEEVISFAVLDNINDLTAVSLMAVCVDGIKCQLLSNTHHCKKLAGDPRRTSTTPVQQQRSRHDSNDTPEQITEHTREENVGILKLNRIHCQLRRLLKHSNFHENVILTAIPEHRSNVLFVFDQDGSSTLTHGHVPGSPRKRLSRQASRDSRDGAFDYSMGVIMFECGLEEVSVTAVRRLGYKDTTDIHLQQKMDNIEKALRDLQESTREEIEQLTESGTSPTDHEPMSSPSSHHSSESISSWDSRLSLMSNASSPASPPTPEPLQGDASNGRLKLKTIWLSFAAPPPVSIKKKGDFTRLDWNLLSTATPAINAWLNPCDRAMMAVKHLVSEMNKRNSSVMACIMTEGLDEQGIHVCNKSKFGKMTSLSKTLQDQPSCQLLTVLRKYLLIHGCESIERAVLSETAPQLITMQKGILALTRQWKNVLYMPYMSDINFKNKKSVRPYNVTFAIPNTDMSENLYDDGEGTIEQFDVVDEKTSLLQAEGGLVMKSTSNPSLISRGGPSSSAAGREHGHDAVSSISTASFQPKKFLATVRSRGRGAFPHPVLSCMDSPERRAEQTQTAATTLNPSSALPRNDSNFSFASAAESTSSLDQGVASTPPHTPLRIGGHKQSILKTKYSKNTDLYQWMTAQQEDFKDPLDDGSHFGKNENMSAHFGSAWSQDDSRTDLNTEYLTMATSIMQLADAQQLFRPLLQSLGLHVEGVRPSAVMKKFGGHLLLQANLDILKIQIAESEASYSKGSHKGKGKGRKYRLNVNAGNSAFSCEGFGVNISMKDVVDFGQTDTGAGGRSKRFAWKFAMHKLEAKPTTLQINFLIKCQAITQNVDMALLRLVHQVVTMVDNIKETQTELKERRHGLEWVKTHRKQESKDSTSSADTQQSDLSKVDQPSGDTQISTPDQSLCSDSLVQEPDKPVMKTPKSISSFRLALDSKRPDKLPLTSSSKKSHLRFAKETKRPRSDVMTPSTHSEVLTPPQSLNLSDSVTMELVDTSSPALAEKTIVDEIKESTPRCWRHLYHLLELYSTMPEPKTVLRKTGMAKLPVIEEEPEKDSTLKRDNSKLGSGFTLHEEEGAKYPDIGAEEQEIGDKEPPLAQTSFIRTRFKQSIYIGESIPLVVFGIAKVEKVQVLAVLSGLKLEAEMRRVHTSGTYKERVKGFLHRKSSDSSFTAHVGHTMIVLLEGVPPSMQTVVTVNIRKSQALHTTVMRRAKEHNSALASIGHIDIDIPQHPVVLHGMMTRSSRQLTSTLQEFGWPLSRSVSKTQSDAVDGEVKEEIKQEKAENLESKSTGRPRRQEQTGAATPHKPVTLHIHFKTVFQGITTAASILPSLKAQHKTGSITVAGMTGKKARFTVVLPKHTLSFRSKVITTETSIPSSASIELPPIHIYADYRHHKMAAPAPEDLSEGLVLKAGSYMNAVAEVGMLEHSLTTDLLNHLVFVQKVFMKEVNEVVQKVSGSDQPMRLWSEEEKTAQAHDRDPLLYSFSFRFKGIQITATTPTSNAVRLETGEIELEVSNRVQMAAREINPDVDFENNQKVFIRAQIYLNVALGQLLKNPVFEEAEPEFQTMAFFKTKIGVRNALQDEMIPGVSTNQEALIINLSRPIVLAQPLAFDKAVLVWLNYKNAYEYWTEQRMSLNKEVQTATRQVIDKLPHFASSAAPPTLSTLFLQLIVDDMGICVPIDTLSYQPTSSGVRLGESEPGAALVLTIESTQISACSSGSLVSKGRFKGFSFRFADDFETSWDDWKPNGKEEPNMNICCVPEGTYEVCSRTINKSASDPRGNAKWILNVQWEMQGIDVHLDTNIGKRLTALGHTLTALAGEATEAGYGGGFGGEDEEDDDDVLDNEVTDNELEDAGRRPSLVSDILPEEIFSQDLDPKERARQIEREMNEQAKVVQDLKQLGASVPTIEAERKKLEELQAILFKDFRRDVFNKLKKQSERASAIREKFGLNPKPSHNRSKSYGGHHGKRKDYSVSDTPSYHTLDTKRQNRTHSIDLTGVSAHGQQARVQFGATRSNTYTPPGTPDALTQSFDESDLPRLRESVSLTDMTSSESDIPSSTDSDTPDSQTNVVFRKKPLKRKKRGDTSSNPSIASQTSKSSPEPNIDFELDVNVFIDNGKCVLYPKQARDEEFKRQLKRDRNPSGEQAASPGMRRKLKRQDSSSTLLQGKKSFTSAIETTVFHLPSVDVKVHYYSKTKLAEMPHSTGSFSDCEKTFSSMDRPDFNPQASTEVFLQPSDNWDTMDGSSSMSVQSRRGAVKKANLYAWLSLQKLPEEMIISPCLLDFLEQALEPLPFSAPIHKKADLMGSVLNMDLDASQASLGSPVSVASFPVDVVVYIKVEPSVIRFNCLPISRVECLLQVPSLELVFSTKKADVEAGTGEGTPPMKAKIPKRGREWSTSGASSSSRARLGSTLSEGPNMSTHSGGLSVTGCLSDFSLYVFHPYGGGQRKLGSIQEHTSGGVLEMSRKDSLSLNVEFIKVNISRSRKMELRGASDNSLSGNKEGHMKSNVVRFSAICDIGTATFKYDMRRLSEILSLPKAWYRRNLARRLFLGDESFAQSGADTEVDGTTSSKKRPTLSTQASLSFPSLNVVEESEPFRQTHHRRVSSGDKLKILISSDLKREISQKSRRGSAIPHSPTEGASKTSVTSGRKNRTYSSPETGRHRSFSAPPAPTRTSTNWETLVLFAVNLSRLDVDVNMSNVMGNTLWSTKELKNHGRLSINSSGHKNLKIAGGLGGSSFESRGGVVGGAIDLQDLQIFFQVTEDPDLGEDPDHRAGVTLGAIEGRIDYMGSSVLMTRLSSLDLLLRDEWHVETESQRDTPLATKRSAYLFVNSDLHWDQFHLMISRSTTPDLIKLVAKLDEFFTQQLTSSKRVLSAFGPIQSRTRTTSHRRMSEDMLSELRHHRHWQRALEHLIGCNFRMLPQILPSEGMILGGVVTLQGGNLSLASFHGINFRSKSWALFHIREPYIYFSTEAQKTPDKGTHVVQDLTFIIGHKVTKGGVSSQPRSSPSAPHMATICKVSRGHYVPQQFTSVQEWFSYAFSSSEMKDLDSFPTVQRDRCESPTDHRKPRKSQVYNHETEMIFAFPSLYMNLKTFHYQGENEPQNDDPQPVVESSFVTEFYDHIFVAMDAEVILFLHDLVSSYIKEKDKGARSSYGQSAKAAKGLSEVEKKKITDPTAALKQDYRDFHCKTWQLEPTVRLLHWASKQIDPVGVDFVLQKLGFSHARVTIPKWMQRGVMDPLDKILSMLVKQLIVTLKDHQEKEASEEVD